MKKHIKVWSPYVRLLHWGLVVAFGVAYATRHSELSRDIHIDAGYVVGGIVIARVLLGVFARDHASFWAFPPNLVAAFGYVKGILAGKSRRHVGHNPAGALAIYALLTTCLLTVVSGYMSLNEIPLLFGLGGDEGAGYLHGLLSTMLITLVGVHLTGVFVGSVVHRENLIGSMITGLKPVRTASYSHWDAAEFLSRLAMSIFFVILRAVDFINRALGGKGIVIDPRQSHWHPDMKQG